MSQVKSPEHVSYPCYIALGANLPSLVGDPKATLRAALAALEGVGAAIKKISKFYVTPCFPAGFGPDYVNAVAEVMICGDSQHILDTLHIVEALYGRTRDVRWEGRVLDIDLLAIGDMVQPDVQTYSRWCNLPLDQQMQETPQSLILPHPRMQDRAFVLVPFMDVAPDWVHPVLGRTVRQMVEDLPTEDVAQVRPI